MLLASGLCTRIFLLPSQCYHQFNHSFACACCYLAKWLHVFMAHNYLPNRVYIVVMLYVHFLLCLVPDKAKIDMSRPFTCKGINQKLFAARPMQYCKLMALI